MEVEAMKKETIDAVLDELGTASCSPHTAPEVAGMCARAEAVIRTLVAESEVLGEDDAE